MIVEMRTYRTKNGMRGAFLDLFQAKTVPEHERLGMRIVGPFLGIDDDDTFFFMRGFPDEETREELKARFYDGRLWKEELESVLMPILERYDVAVVDDPEGKLGW